MITDIAWDFDGTLCDSYPHVTISFQRALENMGIHEREEEVHARVITTIPEAVSHYQAVYNVDGKELQSRFNTYNMKTDYAHVVPFFHVKDALEKVIAMGGRNHIYTHRSKASTWEYITHYSLEHYFTLAITSDDGFPRKPDPSALLALIERAHVKPEELMMVGDRPIDIDAAFGAHASSCFFNSNHLPIPAHATYRVESYFQFITLLERIM